MKHLRKYRFEVYLLTACMVLFGSLLIPEPAFDRWVSPLTLNLNLAAGFVLISTRRKAFWSYAALFAFGLLLYLARLLYREDPGGGLQLVRLVFFSGFYTLVTVEIILQVWRAKEVNHNVIFGLISGYVSLGLVAFFLVLGIEAAQPGSFSGLPANRTSGALSETLLYYAYITLMTIGYGDIVPLTPVARKAAMLIGLAGQFYLVIITAVVVEKYIAARKDTPPPAR